MYVTIGVTLVNIVTEILEDGSNNESSLHSPQRICILNFIYLKNNLKILKEQIISRCE